MSRGPEHDERDNESDEDAAEQYGGEQQRRRDVVAPLLPAHHRAHVARLAQRAELEDGAADEEDQQHERAAVCKEVVTRVLVCTRWQHTTCGLVRLCRGSWRRPDGLVTL
jgi:hypothetical protein